jgi:hypothetical protein
VRFMAVAIVLPIGTGYGRSDWSTKLHSRSDIRGGCGLLVTTGLSHDDSAPVTPHNAPFQTYKAARVHITARRRSGADSGRAWWRPERVSCFAQAVR